MTETSSESRSDAYQRSLDVHRRIEELYPRIEQHSVYFRAMMPADRSLPRPPGRTPGVLLDQTVCSLAIKAATSKRAVLAICELGDGDNAMALARVLLENACLLEWLLRGEGRRRLESYVLFTSVQHERGAATINRQQARLGFAGKTAENMASSAYHRAIWTHVFRDAKGKPTKSDRPTWEFDRTNLTGTPVSVRDLFREITDIDQSFEHEVLYGAIGSDVVHSGPLSLTRILQLMLGRETFILQPMPLHEMCTLSLAASNIAMLLVLASLAEYLGLDLAAELDAIKAAFNVSPSATDDEEPTQ